MTWDEEGAGRALGTRFKLMEAPTHRVRLDEVVREGRRMVRRQRLGAGAGVLALAVAIAIPAALAVVWDPAGTADVAAATEVDVGPVRDATCTIQELARPAGTDFTIERVDPTGRIKLGISSATATLIVWRDGQQSTLTLPGITNPGSLYAVSSRGVIIGSMSGKPWMYRGEGTVEWLALPSGYTSGSPMTINDNDDVAGNVAALQETPGRYSRAAIWPADARDRPVVLEPDQDSTATAIGPDRTVAGTLLNYAGHSSVATVWTPEGDRRVLALPSGWNQSQATGIAGDFVYGAMSRVPTPEPGDYTTPTGPIVFESTTPVKNRDVPARWNLRTGQVEILSSLSGTPTVGAGGWFVVGGAGPPAARADVVVVSPTLQAVRLPIPSWADTASNNGVNVTWISRDGKTIAGNVPMAVGHRPVVWQCR